ncbi:hypothetical protein COU62_04250 [Candidatus Pacearchaeota archaeon CG10_big_fil_rev_8_21_14_0_10_35_219]|nr:hypothetical protein [Candidatus Pacearchaeota archaeon]PIO07322.1 MAG: hypothetical protein COU62_04250 [Candidatus Pacearchaeota archaeon CG10_big_fil_rev_8_21_14_0_10_35_219]PIY81372.1 MAG: hypothetical protein COY79_03795 [Candidatus Pacearchaeota archaeon CG_4_10_14_0_8_um_filter_35_169]PIZ79828.1 MAG: hypothetical protein COY00_03300 [Candidatus Pacearchaeota archaeon CG_4_10_14_0_2_um_filter_35_33]
MNLFGLRYFEVSKIIRMAIRVIAIDVSMLNADRDEVVKIDFIIDSVMSKTVCLQVNAIVNPSVTIIKNFIWDASSFLN